MITKNPRLVIIAGANGSGKTTLTNFFRRKFDWSNYHYINQDEIAQQIFGDWNDPKAIYHAGREVIRMRDNCLQERQNFVIETVLSPNSSVRLIHQALEQNYKTRLFYIGTNDTQINIDRVKERFDQGGHNIPRDTIIKRYNRSLDNLLKVIRMADDGFIIDSTENNKQFNVVLRAKKGIIIKTRPFDKQPQWSQKVIQSLSANNDLDL